MTSQELATLKALVSRLDHELSIIDDERQVPPAPVWEALNRLRDWTFAPIRQGIAVDAWRWRARMILDLEAEKSDQSDTITYTARDLDLRGNVLGWVREDWHRAPVVPCTVQFGEVIGHLLSHRLFTYAPWDEAQPGEPFPPSHKLEDT